MARKVYESVTGTHYTFPVTVSSVRSWIDCNPKYITSDTGIQSAIEATAYFTSGQIMTSGNITDQQKVVSAAKIPVGETEFPTVEPFALASFPEVTTINQAKEVLRGEPYNVHHMKLRTPDAIMAQAIEHSVTFPNWTI